MRLSGGILRGFSPNSCPAISQPLERLEARCWLQQSWEEMKKASALESQCRLALFEILKPVAWIMSLTQIPETRRAAGEASFE